MLRRLTNLLARLRAHPRRRLLGTGLGAIAVLAIFAACDSTNTYPIDYFSEMHYQPSYRTVEPPRYGSPDGIVPVTGRGTLYTRQELAEITENPLPASPEVLARGTQLFTTNCAVCHGQGGQGDGPVAHYFEASIGRGPADLTQQRLQEATDGYLASVINFGLGEYMPAFGHLIPREDQWAIVHHIRVLQGQEGQQGQVQSDQP